MNDGKSINSRRQEDRTAVQVQMDLCIGNETLQAISVNASDSGVQLNVKEPIKIWIRMEKEGEAFIKEGQIVWAKRNEDNSMNYGFEYIEDGK
jgi:hypothetical protein